MLPDGRTKNGQKTGSIYRAMPEAGTTKKQTTKFMSAKFQNCFMQSISYLEFKDWLF